MQIPALFRVCGQRVHVSSLRHGTYLYGWNVFLNPLIYIIAAAAVAQVWIYERGTLTEFSLKIILVLAFQFMVVLLIFTFEVTFIWKIPIIINKLFMTGYMRTITTFFKYCHQVYLNFTRKSTKVSACASFYLIYQEECLQ